ncbi:hypothetical protein J6590_093007 [Homalodisca vitripennis]|nr:hypothetical protein J6590_093007 [Homalodisca vitripennis]
MQYNNLHCDVVVECTRARRDVSGFLRQTLIKRGSNFPCSVAVKVGEDEESWPTYSQIVFVPTWLPVQTASCLLTASQQRSPIIAIGAVRSGVHDHEIIMIAMDEKQPKRSISRLSHRRPPIIVVGAVMSGVHNHEIIMIAMDGKQPRRSISRLSQRRPPIIVVGAVMSGVHDHEIIMIAMDGKQPRRSISRLSQRRPPIIVIGAELSGFHDHEIIMIAMDEKQPMRSISRLSHRRPPIIVIGASDVWSPRPRDYYDRNGREATKA